MGNASQNRNVKGSEEIRVPKYGESEISKGKVEVNDGKDNCDVELSNSGVILVVTMVWEQRRVIN